MSEIDPTTGKSVKVTKKRASTVKFHSDEYIEDIREKIPSYISVTQLTTLLDQTLEREIPGVSFQGELSQVKVWSSGHTYFTIKDEQSQVQCVIWKGTGHKLSFKMEDGLLVQCYGKPKVWNKSGNLQIVISRITPAGEGLLLKKFEELKAKLEREGFFSPERKRELPFFPKSIGIVTSQSGAVIHDIMVRIKERMPSLKVYLIDVKVQGDGSAEEISKAIEKFNQLNNVDVIIVGRGGGSLKDLWSFNEEIVVKAIFASKIPIVSAVGHEVDYTLADYVADVRAPTPTAAAEMVVPHRLELIKIIENFQRRLLDTDRVLRPLEQFVDLLDLRLNNRTSQFFESRTLLLSKYEAKVEALHPLQYIRRLREQVSGKSSELDSLLTLKLFKYKEALDKLEQRHLKSVSSERILRYREGISSLVDRLHRSCNILFDRRSIEIQQLQTRLDASAPQRILDRGFALIKSKGKVVVDIEKISVGDDFTVDMAKGSFDGKATKVYK